MCGIIGIASNKPVSINIIQSLKRLEYRGYDSAGMATIGSGEIYERKCIGRVDKLEKIFYKNPSKDILGIGSTGINIRTYGNNSDIELDSKTRMFINGRKMKIGKYYNTNNNLIHGITGIGLLLDDEGKSLGKSLLFLDFKLCKILLQ